MTQNAKNDNEKAQNLVNIGQDIEISLQRNDFMPSKYFNTQNSSKNGEKGPKFKINAFFLAYHPHFGPLLLEEKSFFPLVGR